MRLHTRSTNTENIQHSEHRACSLLVCAWRVCLFAQLIISAAVRWFPAWMGSENAVRCDAFAKFSICRNHDFSSRFLSATAMAIVTDNAAPTATSKCAFELCIVANLICVPRPQRILHKMYWKSREKLMTISAVQVGSAGCRRTKVLNQVIRIIIIINDIMTTIR